MNPGNGTYTRTGPDDGGPDGVKTFVQFDVANRVSFFRRGPDTDPVMTGNYVYFANGLFQSVTYGNNASTSYTYDNANRLETIEHFDGSTTLLQLDYTYTPNSLPDTITENGAGGLVAAVDFDYDTRGRLIYERREDYVDDNRDYELTYEYDQGGNRTKKIDVVNQREIVYHYDLEAPSLYQSENNRLEYYETFDVVPDPPVVVSTTWYYYNFAGNVTRVVTSESGSNDYTATRFEYAKNGEAVTFVLGETWTWDGQPVCEEFLSYHIAFAREFRYDSARQRYLNRELVPQNLEGGVYTVLSETWSDYDGNNNYGDFSIDAAGLATDLRSFEPGIANVDEWVSAGDVETTYLHSNHLGTLRETTGASTPGLRVYTAFGESIMPQGDRYGYVGALGYQNDSEFPYLHVGERYYDPSTGRFLQRDPIGILDGTNVYAYASNNPVANVDPSGLSSVDKAFAQAMAKGNVKLVQTLLESAGEMLKPAARQGVQQWVKKMRTPAVDWAKKNLKGDIWRKFPGGEKGELAKKTLEEIRRAARRRGNRDAKTAWKILNNNKFRKSKLGC